MSQSTVTAEFPTRQAQKSDQTRRAILEAAIQCLAEAGYTKSTMTAIAKRAGLSRGAMQYHFETMQDVLLATIEYIQTSRVAELTADGRRTASQGPGEDRFEDRVAALWAFLHEPASIAFFELAVASRSDSGLNATMQSAQGRFWERWVSAALDAYPEWQDKRVELELACGFSQTLLEGLRLRDMTGQTNPALSLALRDYLSVCIRDIFENGSASTRFL
ncbi:MAG: TetR/AcrR family transcriptional regulator [Alphaproteobacteria bacterium]